MDMFLTNTVILLAFVVSLGYFNEKVTKLTHEIALMLFSVAIGGVLVIASLLFQGTEMVMVSLQNVQYFNLEEFLMEGVLCFMLFAGSCHMRLLDFKKYARAISVLSVGATFLGAAFYGILFYGAGKLLGLALTLPVCLMFGSIVAPTDPIAATSILKKFHLPSNISFIIEGESLLNDGVGVALFVFFSTMVTAGESGGFFQVMAKEILGAVLVGAAATAVCFPIFKKTCDEARQIFTSLLAVSLAYLLCERFGFSGAIASVVCGVLFSGLRNYSEAKGEKLELEQFDGFWEILDTLLNSVLYVMLGLSFVHILQMPHVLILSVAAVIANLLGRAGSLGVSSVFVGPLPDGYSKPAFIKLLTWGGLRGGLSVALAMSAQSMLDDDVFHIILGGTYAIVFFTTIIQGLTMPGVYKKIQEEL
ncbi:Na(+)/H(+) antiporter NhaP [Lachnospiraceae bacterium]|nr:sodium:proton antiporter [Lachnospiraceae bacterium]GFI33158.1 Na(+)/H(+) antiporter NhaP [Lachnospiraceae bacterium]